MAKSPDKIQQKCTCTDHKRAGTKVPSTSAHSLYAEWQYCSLIFAKHATSWDEKGKNARKKKKRMKNDNQGGGIFQYKPGFMKFLYTSMAVVTNEKPKEEGLSIHSVSPR
jgi:hypothetical protein